VRVRTLNTSLGRGRESNLDWKLSIALGAARIVVHGTDGGAYEGRRRDDGTYEYFAALKVAGRSPRTIGWYRDNLLEFIRFAERDGRSATLGDLQAPVVRRWLLSLQSRPPRLAPSSTAGLASMRDRAIVLPLLDTGLRVSEAAGIGRTALCYVT
jgi:integrase